MSEIMKLSKYNFKTYDNEGNLIIYNFLKGIPSLTKILKSDIEKFTRLFLTNTKINKSNFNKHIDVMKRLIDSGILVGEGTDENILYEGKYYEQVYDNKLMLTILTTGKCNFNCSYCLESEQNISRKAMTEENQNAILQFVQKQIHNQKELQVSWFGGEPLLEPKVIRYLSENFIKICNARLLPYSAQITTNGFCLDADMFDMLYKLKVYTYMITVDGFKDQHDKLRITHNGAGTFDRIMDNLLRIRNNKHYKFAHIIIRVNITKSLLNVLDDFVYYIASLFADDPRFAFIFVPAENYSKTKCSDNNIFVDGEEVFGRLLENDVYVNKLHSEQFKAQIITSNEGCPANTKNSFVITPDLKVCKCCAHYDMKTNNIGYIDLKGDLVLDEAIHSKWYLINKYIPRVSDNCQDCFYLPVCNKNIRSCPAQYLKTIPQNVSCPLKNEKFIEALSESILYVAQKYDCTQLVL